MRTTRAPPRPLLPRLRGARAIRDLESLEDENEEANPRLTHPCPLEDAGFRAFSVVADMAGEKEAAAAMIEDYDRG